MKKQNSLMIQKILMFLAFILSITFFIFILGFMTNFYVLMVDGTFDMFEYYKSLQVLVKAVFNISILFIVYGVMVFVFDLHKDYPGIYGTVAATGFGGYLLMKSMPMFRYITHYKSKYNAIDFSKMEEYTTSPWMFDILTAAFAVMLGVIAIGILTVLWNFIKDYRESKAVNKLGEMNG